MNDNNLNIDREKAIFEQLLQRVGQTARVITKLQDGSHEREVKAIITPLRYKNKMYLEGIVDKIGYIDERHYLYIGPAVMNFKGMSLNTEIHTANGNYVIKAAEPVLIGDRVLYVWAILQALHKGDNTWTI